MMHYPVMLPEILSALKAQNGDTYIDGTFGNGGYSQAILEAADCTVIALDRDPSVVERASVLTAEFGKRFRFQEMPFSKLDQIPGVSSADAVILDIGVSSMQIDQAERGFSFMRPGPLDMRMSQDGPSAADAVNNLDLKDMTRIFQAYGEEKRARRAAQAIINAREQGDILTTDALASVIEDALGRTGKIHPATRVFQALRIFVNDELGELYEALCAAERILNPGGRLIVVTFHSLEDRIVKRFMHRRSQAPSAGSRYMPGNDNAAPELSFTQPERGAVFPSKAEIAENPRSRSAKIRWAVRTNAPAFDMDDDILPRAPRITDYRWAA